MPQPVMQRMTRQRRLILDVLCEVTTHPTADALHHMVRRRLPHVSLGTVYRNLDLLTRCGLVRRLDLAGGPARYDGNMMRHDHIRCMECGRVDDVDPIIIDVRRDPAVRKAGYRLTGYHLDLEGVCPLCSKSDDKKDCAQKAPATGKRSGTRGRGVRANQKGRR